jgi:hypothetical protein
VPTYNHLQQLAAHVKPIEGQNEAAFVRVGFPQSWYTELMRKVFRPDTEDDKQRGLPLWATNNAISALMPAVLTNNATGKPGTSWLAWSAQSATPDLAHLVEMLRGGMMAAAEARNKKPRRRRIDLPALAEVLQGFQAQDLQPQQRALSYLPGHKFDADLYGLLPQAVALHLARAEWAVEHGDYDHELGRRVAAGVSTWRRTAMSEGAEMVSWPPHVYTTRHGTRYGWSYTLRITVQTQPLAGRPLLHITLGIRRWARYGVWDGARSIGVHLPAASGWDEPEGRIGVAAIKWQPGPRGSKEGRMVWNDEIVAALERISQPDLLPDPRLLAREPMDFLEPADHSNPVAAVVFRHGLGEHSKHAVGDGVSARDRWRIFDQFMPAVADFATPTRPASRVQARVRQRPKAADQLRIDHQALAAAVQAPMEITAWYATTAMRSTIIETVADALGAPLPADLLDASPAAYAQHSLQAPGLDVTLRIGPIGALAGDLAIDRTITNRTDRIGRAFSQRATETVRHLTAGAQDAARFAIIEMGDAGEFTSAEHDPKQAVKAGAGTLEILTQNITPPKPDEPESTRRERARKAVGDLLVRQTGILARPPYLGTNDYPLENVATLGLWVVRRNGDFRAVLPLAVAWLPDEPFARIRLPHDDQWLPHHIGARHLANWDTARTLTNEQVQDFFADVVAECADGGDTAMFTLAQNIRSNCPPLTNAGMIQDELAFASGKTIPPDQRKGVRHLRLRTNLRCETPQHVGVREEGDKKIIGIGSGLWADADHSRLFYSTSAKPVSAGPGSPGGSRIETHWGRNSKGAMVEKVDILKKVWNPQLLEILFNLAHPDDEPEAWAALAHQHRYTAAHFADPLLLPGVLHLARKLGESILPAHEIEPIDHPTD